MKKILGTLIFFGIGTVFFISVSYMLRPIDRQTKGNVFYREGIPGFYAEKDESLDIVALGASGISHFLYNFILWEEYNLTSYNLGTSNQSCYIIEELIDEVEKTQSPQLYIVETRKFIAAQDKDHNENSFRYVLNNKKYSWNRIELINYLIEDWQERLLYYFDIAFYHDNWENFSYENFKYADNEAENFLKGWKTINRMRKVRLKNRLPVTKENELPIAPDTEDALISLMEKCKEESIQVLFVATPWQINEENQRKNMYLRRIIEEAGFQFLDTNQYIDEMKLDGAEDFWDRKHTNIYGAEKFTYFLGEYIQQNFALSTEHTEEVTAHWNQTAEKNRTYAEELKAKIVVE